MYVCVWVGVGVAVAVCVSLNREHISWLLITFVEGKTFRNEVNTQVPDVSLAAFNLCEFRTLIWKNTFPSKMNRGRKWRYRWYSFFVLLVWFIVCVFLCLQTMNTSVGKTCNKQMYDCLSHFTFVLLPVIFL